MHVLLLCAIGKYVVVRLLETSGWLTSVIFLSHSCLHEIEQIYLNLHVQIKQR